LDELHLAEISQSTVLGSLAHLKGFLQSLGVSVFVEQIQYFPGEDLWTKHKADLSRCRAIRIPFGLSETFVKSFEAVPTLVKQLQCCDTLLNEAGQYWPRILIYDAIRKLVVESFPEHDVRGTGYVVCDDSLGRAMAAVLAHLGHRKIFLVGKSESFLQREVKLLQRHFLGVDIRGVLAEQLTMQSDRASMLVNCVDLETEHQLLQDIVYFNFMQRGGVVLDLGSCGSGKSPLNEEAQKAHLSTLDPILIRAANDFALIERLGLSELTSFHVYFESWSKFNG
jgi:shikimate dehydrogenase